MIKASDWADKIGKARCRAFLADTDSSRKPEMVFVLGDANKLFGGYYMSVYAGSAHIHTCYPDIDFMLTVVSVPLDEDIGWWVDEVRHTGKWDFTDPGSFVSGQLASMVEMYMRL